MVGFVEEATDAVVETIGEGLRVRIFSQKGLLWDAQVSIITDLAGDSNPTLPSRNLLLFLDSLAPQLGRVAEAFGESEGNVNHAAFDGTEGQVVDAVDRGECRLTVEFELAFVSGSAFGVVEVEFGGIGEDAHRVGGYVRGQAIACRAGAGDGIPSLVLDYNGTWAIAEARSANSVLEFHRMSDLLLEILSLELVFLCKAEIFNSQVGELHRSHVASIQPSRRLPWC